MTSNASWRTPRRRERLVPLTPERFRAGDVYIEYSFEDVLFRYEYATRRFFRRFVGESTESEVAFDNRLLNDAIRFGDEVGSARYWAGADE
jgi:hypothetical protein